jgi:hypothetical protein
VEVRLNGEEAHSEDGLYRAHTGSPGYVSISCELSGLPDNTYGKIGYFTTYLQHPDEEVSAELLAGARRFARALWDAVRAREEARLDAEAEALDREWEEPREERQTVRAKYHYRSSEEAWEAEDEEAWARMRRVGL